MQVHHMAGHPLFIRINMRDLWIVVLQTGVLFFSSMLKDHKCETKHMQKFCVILQDHNISYSIKS